MSKNLFVPNALAVGGTIKLLDSSKTLWKSLTA